MRMLNEHAFQHGLGLWGGTLRRDTSAHMLCFPALFCNYYLSMKRLLLDFHSVASVQDTVLRLYSEFKLWIHVIHVTFPRLVYTDADGVGTGPSTEVIGLTVISCGMKAR